jgi:hypothetical protein
MATVLVGTTQFTYGFKDRNKNTRGTTISFALPDTTTLAELQTFADYIGVRAAAVSDATYLGASIAIGTREDPEPTGLAVVGSDVERKGSFTFRNSGGGASTIKIPSFKSSMVLDGSNAINTADTAVAALITALLDGPVGFDNGAATSTGLQYEALIDARKTHVGSSQG